MTDQNSPAPAADEDEAAWAEVVKAKQDAAPKEEPAPAAFDEDGQPQAPVTMVDAPAAAPAPKEDPADPPAAEPPAWKNAPEQWRTAFEAEIAERDRKAQEAEQKARSANGRYAAAQRRIAELERYATQPKTSEPASKPAAGLTERLAALKEEYPEIAEPLTAIAGAVDELRGSEQRRQEDALAANARAVFAAVPDMLEVVKTDEFVSWIEDEAPVRVRRLFEANSQAFVDPQGAIEVMQAFKATRGQQPATPPANPANQPDLRSRQLRAGAAPRPQGGRPSVSGLSPEAGTEEDHWADIVRRREARKQA